MKINCIGYWNESKDRLIFLLNQKINLTNGLDKKHFYFTFPNLQKSFTLEKHFIVLFQIVISR